MEKHKSLINKITNNKQPSLSPILLAPSNKLFTISKVPKGIYSFKQINIKKQNFSNPEL